MPRTRGTGCLGGGCEIGSAVVTEPATMAPTQPLGDMVRGKSLRTVRRGRRLTGCSEHLWA